MSKTATSSNTWFETLVEAWLIYLTTEEPRWRADAWVSSTTFTIGEPFGWSKVGWRRTYWDSVQLFEFPERKTTSNHGELIGRPANQRAVSSRVDREPLMWLLSRSQALPIRRFCLWAKYIYIFFVGFTRSAPPTSISGWFGQSFGQIQMQRLVFPFRRKQAVLVLRWSKNYRERMCAGARELIKFFCFF